MIKKIVFGLLIGIMFFIVLDMALRAYLSVKNKDNQYLKFVVAIEDKGGKQFRLDTKFVDYQGYYKLTPGKFKGKTMEMEFPYSINSLGFRGREFLKEKPKGCARICVFGGSSTFGFGVTDQQTYPVYLEEILNAHSRGKRYEVINCGLPAYRMKDIYNLFRNEVIRYNPDILVIYEAWNDAFYPDVIRNKSALLKLHDLFYYKWMLYTLVLEKYSTLKQNNPFPFFYKNKKIPGDYSAYLRLLVDLAEKNKIGVVLVKQPTNYRLSGFVWGCPMGQLEDIYEGCNNLMDSYAIAQRYYVKEMEQIGRLKGLLIADPISAIEGRGELFIDPIHLAPKGNKILAGIIAKEFRNNTKDDDYSNAQITAQNL
jgi:hypothetical protein